jgi:hypothetical protein
MKFPLQTRALLLILASATALLGQVDAREIIRRAVAADERNWKLARNYIFSERADLRYLDSEGAVKLREISIHDVMLLDGSPYERLVARNDRPLSPAEERKEQEKFAKSAAERRAETAAKRAQRLAEYFERPEWQREAWHELPEAFDFRLVAEEVWEGHTLYVIDTTPRPGYQPRCRTAKMLTHVHAKLWVDKQDYHLVKGEVEVVDTISVGLFLVLVSKGSRASFEETRVNDEIWFPSKVRASASARLGLLKVVRIQQEYSYSKCREFQTDAPIVSRITAR